MAVPTVFLNGEPFGQGRMELEQIVAKIDSGAEAYARIRAGAALVQIYSALVYAGPGLPARVRNLLVSSNGPALTLSQGVAVRQKSDDSPVTAADLAGKTISVARGTLEDLSVTKIAPPSATIKRFDDPNGAISAFLSGQVQLMVVGNDVGATILARHPANDPEQKFSLFSSPDHVGLIKNEPRLKQKVDETIAKARKDGTMNAISQKWLRAPLPADL